MREFYGCYLLVSKHEKCKGRTYIGFTVNPRRRIRQHNGQLVNGAWKTSRFRPWDMVLVVYGFVSKVHALQFEWAWQHPAKSKAARGVAQRMGKAAMNGAKGKARLLHEMLNVSPWRHYPLQLQLLSSEYAPLLAKCPQLPPHMPVCVAPLEALPEAVGDDAEAEEAEAEAEAAAEAEAEPSGGDSSDCETQLPAGSGAEPAASAAVCALCSNAIASGQWHECGCGARMHQDCLVHHFLEEGGCPDGSMPSHGTCPACEKAWAWLDALRSGGSVGWQNRRPGRRRKAKSASPSKRSRQTGAAAAAKSKDSGPLLPAGGVHKRRGKAATAAAAAAAAEPGEEPASPAASVSKRAPARRGNRAAAAEAGAGEQPAAAPEASKKGRRKAAAKPAAAAAAAAAAEGVSSPGASSRRRASSSGRSPAKPSLRAAAAEAPAACSSASAAAACDCAEASEADSAELLPLRERLQRRRRQNADTAASHAPPAAPQPSPQQSSRGVPAALKRLRQQLGGGVIDLTASPAPTPAAAQAPTGKGSSVIVLT